MKETLSASDLLNLINKLQSKYEKVIINIQVPIGDNNGDATYMRLDNESLKYNLSAHKPFMLYDIFNEGDGHLFIGKIHAKK